MLSNFAEVVTIWMNFNMQIESSRNVITKYIQTVL